MKIYTIYKITNLINNKIYIGVTNDYQKRINAHKNSYSKSGLISKTIKKYLWENFKHEIIYQTNDKEYAYNIAEPHFIKEYQSNNLSVGYNLTSGGEGTLGFKPSKKSKAKMSKARKGKTYEEIYGPLKAKEIIEKKKLIKRIQTPKTRKKIAKKLKGNKHFLGHSFSPEVLKILSEQKAKDWILISPSGEKTYIHNMRQFCLKNNLHHSAIVAVLQGKQKHHKKWTKP